MSTDVEQRLKEVEGFEALTHEPYDDDVGCPKCGHVIGFDFDSEPVGICNSCAYELIDHIPFLLALVRKYRDYLKEIARPALGGKLQQAAAQEALKFNPERKIHE